MTGDVADIQAYMDRMKQLFEARREQRVEVPPRLLPGLQAALGGRAEDQGDVQVLLVPNVSLGHLLPRVRELAAGYAVQLDERPVDGDDWPDLVVLVQPRTEAPQG